MNTRGAMMVLAAACSMVATGATGLPAAQATFSSRTEAVRIDVLVTANRQPIAGLGARDFEVRDNGVLQDVNLISFDQIPLSVVLAFDVSESVAGQRLADLQVAARALISRLRADDRAGLVTFSAVVARRSDMTTDHAQVVSALGAVTPDSGTALVDGVHAGIALGASDDTRAVMVVFSDGLDVSSWLPPASVVRAARQSDVVCYAVTVGSKSLPRLTEREGYEDAVKRVLDSRQFLRDIADATGGQVLDLDSTRDLDGAFERIIDEFRTRYVVSYVPRGVAKDGWHKVEVRIKGRRDATVKARTGYQAG